MKYINLNTNESTLKRLTLKFLGLTGLILIDYDRGHQYFSDDNLKSISFTEIDKTSTVRRFFEIALLKCFAGFVSVNDDNCYFIGNDLKNMIVIGLNEGIAKANISINNDSRCNMNFPAAGSQFVTLAVSPLVAAEIMKELQQ